MCLVNRIKTCPKDEGTPEAKEHKAPLTYVSLAAGFDFECLLNQEFLSSAYQHSKKILT